MPPTILVVEDDPAVRRSLCETIADEGLNVAAAESAEAALAVLARLQPDIILSDIRMTGLDGLELLRIVRERAPGVDVVLMTAFDDIATVVRAMREGAFDFLVKPLRTEELRAVLNRGLDDRRSREAARRAVEAEAKAYDLTAMVGRHPAMIEVYKRAGHASASRVNVLIRGETGTGKEMIARAIHYNSDARAEPFLPVNCTAVPQELLESELFGHVRGAFTGAVSDRRGRFAMAGRGTLFLDEIGDTSAALQAKLLRVLEDRRFHPVGAERAETSEARVIAATHRDLERMVGDGRFREDLYYRLRVVEIRLPPLRERIADLPHLARHFVRKASHELHVPEATIPDATLAVLLEHTWPGNVRELENCLMRAVVLAPGGVLRPEHLGLDARSEQTPDCPPTLEAIEREHVQRVLAFTAGNRTRSAEILGISKPRLYRLIQKHRLESRST